eukprot:TRINITY_DN1186_c0_g1_i2.p1 TRINITY_DN1186_c0_g1~~TRINITY_DN1186_c0_g1_i2.p1  ORF type:complete len:264 (-),score=65.02 TRINITY_DN1186_c0_g1_i2:38-799(-)
MQRIVLFLLFVVACILCTTPLVSASPSSSSSSDVSSSSSSGTLLYPLGDSITWGCSDCDNSTCATCDGGYRTLLYSLLNVNANYTFVGSQSSGPETLDDKHHEGHPGWRIDEIYDNIVGWLNTYHPDIITVHLGTNDVFQNANASTCISRWNQLMDAIFKQMPKVTVYACSIIPFTSTRFPYAHQPLTDFNAALPSLVQSFSSQGFNIHFVDMYDAVPTSGLSPDGIHPVHAGYNLMAQTWYKAISTTYSEKN